MKLVVEIDLDHIAEELPTPDAQRAATAMLLKQLAYDFTTHADNPDQPVNDPNQPELFGEVEFGKSGRAIARVLMAKVAFDGSVLLPAADAADVLEGLHD